MLEVIRSLTEQLLAALILLAVCSVLALFFVGTVCLIIRWCWCIWGIWGAIMDDLIHRTIGAFPKPRPPIDFMAKKDRSAAEEPIGENGRKERKD